MATISFLGDIGLNDRYNDLYKQNINPFSDVEEILKQSDFVVGNLECTVKGDKGENYLKRPRLYSQQETLNYLKNINLGLAILANNHVYDNLEDGFIKTTDFLSSNGIAYCGASTDLGAERNPFIKTIQGKNFIFLNYVTRDTNPNEPENIGLYINYYNPSLIIQDIKRYKPVCDYLILNVHWGGRLESAGYPDFYQITDSHSFIDAGADVVVGHHSHVLQPFEKYKGKYIFYSLGNFCFSDISFEGKIIPILQRPGYSNAAIARVNFVNSGIYASMLPIENKNLTIILQNKFPVRFKIYKFLFPLVKSSFICWSIYFHFVVTLRKLLYKTKIAAKTLFKKK